jgi:serine/threonine-protein kinase
VIGTTFGQYRIEALIGRGGMGEVYRALDTGQDGRAVALKVLPAGLSDDPQFVARFRREAEIAARLSEPHVVPIHRYGEIDGRLFLDMQLVDGRDLADVLARDGLPAPDRALAILEQVAGALDAAHADGLVHRDVKPSNILLTQPGAGRPEFAYLLDFGIARATEPGSRTAITRTGAVIGTLSYMAPERFLAQPAGPAADVYALACVLHEMLTGTRPYPGTGYATQVAGHLHQAPPRPSAVRPGLPAALDGVVARGMAKDPAARYRTAGELLGAAREAMAGVALPALPVAAVPRGAVTVVDEPAPPTWVPSAGPPPPWVPAVPPPPRRRSRWLPVLGIAALAVAVLATVLIVVRPPAGAGATGAEAAAPAPAAAPADALPSAAPITERTIVGAAPDVWAPVVAELDGTPVLVSLGLHELAVYDMATGERIGKPLDGLLAGMAATVARVDGRSVLITAGADRVIRLRDLATGEPLATTMTGHTGMIMALMVVEVDGRQVLVSGGDDGTVRRWDLATASPIGEPVTGISGRVTKLAATRLGDRPVVLVRGFDGFIHSFDAGSGAPVGPPVPSVADGIATLALPGGTAVLSRPDYGRMEVVDLRSGAALGPAVDRFLSLQLTATVIAGRPLLLDVDGDNIVIKDLGTGRPVGSPLTGHESSVTSLTPVVVGGSTYLVSTSHDRTIRIWDLTARARG